MAEMNFVLENECMPIFYKRSEYCLYNNSMQLKDGTTSSRIG